MASGAQVWSTTAGSNNSIDTNVNWAEGQAPSSVNNSARAEMASVAMHIGDNSGQTLTAGTTAAYTITSKQVSTALVDGYTIAARMHATNESGATLNVDGVGAKAIQVNAGTAVSGGQLVGGTIHRFTYSTSSTGWILNHFFGSTGAAQLGADGTAAAPSYSFSLDTDVGLYRKGSNNPAISAGSVTATEWTTSGNINYGTFTSSGAATFASSATFGNSVLINGTFTSTGFASLGSSLEVTGAARFAGTGAILGAATLSSSLTVANATLLSSALTVTGAVTALSSATVTNNLLVGGALTVTSATQTSSLGVTGSASVGSTLHVGGAASVAGALTVTGNANASSITSTGATNLQTLTVSGATVLAGAATASSTLHVVGATSVAGALTAASLVVSGTANIADTTLIGGAWTSFTPTITAPSGSFSSASASGRYRLVGKTCHVKIDVTVSSIGSGSGGVNASMPFTAASSVRATFAGVNVNGSAARSVVAYINASSATLFMIRYDGNSITDGGNWAATGDYEIA